MFFQFNEKLYVYIIITNNGSCICLCWSYNYYKNVHKLNIYFWKKPQTNNLYGYKLIIKQ